MNKCTTSRETGFAGVWSIDFLKQHRTNHGTCVATVGFLQRRDEEFPQCFFILPYDRVYFHLRQYDSLSLVCPNSIIIDLDVKLSTRHIAWRHHGSPGPHPNLRKFRHLLNWHYYIMYSEWARQQCSNTEYFQRTQNWAIVIFNRPYAVPIFYLYISKPLGLPSSHPFSTKIWLSLNTAVIYVYIFSRLSCFVFIYCESIFHSRIVVSVSVVCCITGFRCSLWGDVPPSRVLWQPEHIQLPRVWNDLFRMWLRILCHVWKRLHPRSANLSAESRSPDQ